MWMINCWTIACLVCRSAHVLAKLSIKVMMDVRNKDAYDFVNTETMYVSQYELQATNSFVNSQEWTISRSVPDLRLGIVGALNSGKSALVHRYLTGSYMQEDRLKAVALRRRYS
ncbi:unnamed protein product [Ceratitis capitata]|uniref:(Mediterranean fruit fly) hypothetical protein n=1 Tax=Ceratitis capitata TaxID=7213 RepID=A0A811UEN0_CERCA|nr:unnamed protein product [Ceratitis capitata]